MSNLSVFQLGKGVYRYRKPLAILVIVESVVSYQLKRKKKSRNKSMEHMRADVSDKASTMLKQAEEYINDFRKRMKH